MLLSLWHNSYMYSIINSLEYTKVCSLTVLILCVKYSLIQFKPFEKQFYSLSLKADSPILVIWESSPVVACPALYFYIFSLSFHNLSALFIPCFYMIYLRSFVSFSVKYKFFIHTTTKGWGGQRPNSWQTCSGVKLLLSMFSMMMGIWAWRTRLQVATRSGEMTARAAQMAAIQSAIYTQYITVYAVTAGYYWYPSQQATEGQSYYSICKPFNICL